MRKERTTFLRNYLERTLSEKGQIMLLVAVVIGVVFMVTAFVIDLSREELVERQLQVAVENTALAAVQSIKGTPKSWVQIKKVALATLANHQITGATQMPDINTPLDRAFPAILARDPVDTFHTGSEGSSGNLEIVIERGFYRNNSPAGFVFHSLEGSGLEGGRPDAGIFTGSVRPFSDLVDVQGVPDIDLTGSVPAVYGMPAYAIGNAVRVTVRMTSLPTSFASILGFNTFGTIEKTATAVADRELETCVAPMAITACSLLLNTDMTIDSDDPRITMDGYNPNMACERELIFREATYDVPQRREGIARSEIYPRRPYFGAPTLKDPLNLPDPTDVGAMNAFRADNMLNRRAVPISGVLGLPERNGRSGGPNTTPAELANFLVNGTGNPGSNCPPGTTEARIGDSFYPVDAFFDPSDPNDLTPIDDPAVYDVGAVETALANFIQDPAQSGFFRDIFGEPATQLARNYPFPRQMRADLPDFFGLPAGFEPSDPTSAMELMLTWPTNFGLSEDALNGNSQQAGRILLSPKMENQWTDPLCHSPLINEPDTFGAGTSGARARTVKVAVIAPMNAKADPDGTPYCDWQGTFKGVEQVSFQPTSGTAPVVIGFVDAHLFDFNFRNLMNPGGHQGPLNPNTPFYDHGPTKIQDTNPWMMEKKFEVADASAFVSNIGDFLIDSMSLDQRLCVVQCQNNIPVGCTDPILSCHLDVPRPPSIRGPYFDFLGSFRFRDVSPYNLLLDPSNIQKAGGSFCSTAVDPTDTTTWPDPNTWPDPSSIPGWNGPPTHPFPPGVRWANPLQQTLFGVNQAIGKPALDAWVKRITGIDDFVIDPLTFKTTEFLQWSTGTDIPFPTPPGCPANQTPFSCALQNLSLVIGNVLARVMRGMACENFVNMLDLVAASDVAPMLSIIGVDPNDVADIAVADNSEAIGGPPIGDSNYWQDHALPMKLNDRWDTFDANSWEEPQPLRAQHGCGGIRARLSCGAPESKPLPTARDLSRTQPALVE